MTVSNSDIVTSAQSAVDSLVAVAVNPDVAIRIITRVYNDLVAYTDPLGNLLRQTLLTAMADSVADYRLTSRSQATRLLDEILPCFDSELNLVQDVSTFLSLKKLRADLVTDLEARGLQLPELIQITTPAPMPSLALAYKLYQDATRAGEVVAQNDASAPAFLPISLTVLSS